MSRIRAYLAASLDGFVAGPHDELAWLEGRAPDAPPFAVAPWRDASDEGVLEFGAFLTGVGCILMGRRTYDIVEGFPEWPYGDVPMRIATHRPLDAPHAWVEPIEGDIADLIARASEVAGEGDVYVDGAALVRETLEAGLLDHLVLTLVPTVLGDGISLFGGLTVPAEMTVERVARYGDGLVQLHLRPRAD